MHAEMTSSGAPSPAPAHPPVIEVSNLRKTYDKGRVEAVRDVSLTVRRGTCFGLLGPNGAGKSTTLELMQGLLRPTAGSVRLFGLGYDTDERAIRARMGGILQENRLYEKMRVREAISLFASLYPSPVPTADLLDMLDLRGLENRYLKALSGGQRQRVFIATAVVGNPELLFLDEPTTGLDPSTRQDFWELILRLKREGKTVVLSTHYMDEAEFLCDELVIVDKGLVIEKGSPAEIIERVMKNVEVVVKPRKASLNDVFLKLTGRSLGRPETVE